MRKKRVTGRFFIFIAIIVVIIALIVYQFVDFGGSEDYIFSSTATYAQELDGVIIRDEEVYTSESTVRVEYIAKEYSLISEGDTVAYLYTTGYSESLLEKLETTRQNIQSYHKTLLGTIVDSDLDRLEAIIDLTAQEFKNLVTQKTRGNLQTVTEQLETAMVNRQEYLRRSKRDDPKLTTLDEEENTRLTSIQSWRQTSQASMDGVVSFYVDGYETDLSPDLLDSLTVSDIQTVLDGGELTHTEEIQSDGIYRLVNQDQWYVAVVENSDTWNPVVGLEYYLTIEGYEDLTYSAVVTNVQKSGGNVLAILEIDEPIGSLLYQRSGKITLSTSVTALAVREHALYTEGGQLGVWLYDTPGGTFVPVEVLYTDGETYLIQPLVDGALELGQRLLIK